MSKQIYLEVKVQHPGMHRWKDASEKYAYLREWHRHIFHFHIRIITEYSRQVEFDAFSDDMRQYVTTMLLKEPVEYSCEDMAHELIEHLNRHLLKVKSVGVFEDGVNGAIVEVC